MKLFKKIINHSSHLKKIKCGTYNPNSQNHLLFCTLRNEKIRMPFFLQYYRNMGIQHFFFVDNDSSDGFIEYVKGMEDITVYHTNHSYKHSEFGMNWLNFLLTQYGMGKWCLVCDPDEFLVYPNCEINKIPELTKHLDSQNKISFYSTMLDMYPKEEKQYIEGENPLVSCPYFDKSGYTYTEITKSGSLWVRGGPRGRLLYKDDKDKSPALNKIPLIKWHLGFYFLSSMHLCHPNAVNAAYLSQTTGAILHFKFLSTFKEKVKEEMLRGQHYDNSAEYKKYNESLNSLYFFDPKISTKYINSNQLIKLKLINHDKKINLYTHT